MQHNITSSGLWDDSRFGIGVAFAIKIDPLDNLTQVV